MIFHISHVQRLVNSRESMHKSTNFHDLWIIFNFFFHSLSLNYKYFRQIWILSSMISYKSHFFTEINWRKKLWTRWKTLKKLCQTITSDYTKLHDKTCFFSVVHVQEVSKEKWLETLYQVTALCFFQEPSFITPHALRLLWHIINVHRT